MKGRISIRSRTKVHTYIHICAAHSMYVCTGAYVFGTRLPARLSRDFKQQRTGMQYVPSAHLCHRMCMYVSCKYVCVCVCMCMCMYVYVCMCMCMCMYVPCKYVCVCMCMCMYVCVCVCVCMYRASSVCVLYTRGACMKVRVPRRFTLHSQRHKCIMQAHT